MTFPKVLSDWTLFVQYVQTNIKQAMQNIGVYMSL